jgi:hypothetical protein
MIALFFVSLASAAPSAGDFGIGMGIGAPTGVTGKLMVNDWSGIQFSAGGDLGRIGDIGLSCDYVINTQPLNNPADGYTVRMHFGLGFSMSANTEEFYGATYLGPRLGIAGVNIVVDGMPIDLFVETAPTLYFFQSISWGFDGQIGVRYYF